jgi:hypothetical protein
VPAQIRGDLAIGEREHGVVEAGVEDVGPDPLRHLFRRARDRQPVADLVARQRQRLPHLPARERGVDRLDGSEWNAVALDPAARHRGQVERGLQARRAGGQRDRRRRRRR